MAEDDGSFAGDGKGSQEFRLRGGRTVRLIEEQPQEEFAPIFSDAWTGSRVWGAAHVLTSHMSDLAEAGGLRGARVLELGAGPGMCGLAAAALGAASVALTDQKAMVSLLERNIKLNPELGGAVTAAELNWGGPHAGVAPYDVVLVSDCVNILYGEASFGQLAGTIHALCAPRGVCLLTHAERAKVGAEETGFNRFTRLCESRGLSVRRLECVRAPAEKEDSEDIGLYEIRHGGSSLEAS
ncbi:putative methyltransferase-domain-containing protein [Pavlovales sp. CCMP2436]|nr:putative methyltransferase-domain-containing protein [Pavlovales sp. CCMP2436]